jgi:hypothetical protein
MSIPYRDFLIIVKSHEVKLPNEHKWELEASTQHIENTNCDKISVVDTDYERALKRIKEQPDKFYDK